VLSVVTCSRRPTNSSNVSATNSGSAFKATRRCISSCRRSAICRRSSLRVCSGAICNRTSSTILLIGYNGMPGNESAATVLAVPKRTIKRMQAAMAAVRQTRGDQEKREDDGLADSCTSSATLRQMRSNVWSVGWCPSVSRCWRRFSATLNSSILATMVCQMRSAAGGASVGGRCASRYLMSALKSPDSSGDCPL
jgi:hypothetical protein